MSHRKLIVSMGSDFAGNYYVRFDLRDNKNPENSKWYCLMAEKSDEMNPLFNYEVPDNEINRGTMNLFIEEIKNEQIQNNSQ